ncbi:MAG: DNA repair protein RecN [Candidatus Solibacter usitatus]|nr:DNA repair protein RecN [Candidatus Solibacter usitatus]
MLLELIVENYAVVERLRIRFQQGMHVLSGETGSGKSILVGAFGLLLGARASAEIVRTGCDRARVAGIFELPETKAVTAVLESLGIATEAGELLLEREILANGKSRAFASGRPVTLAVLKTLSSLVGDIHGQHDQQRLFDHTEQLAMLDEFAAQQKLMEDVADDFAAWKSACITLEELDRSEQERLRMADLWTHQVREIEGVGPKAGEDEALRRERNVLANLAKLEENARAAIDLLYESETAAVASMGRAKRHLEALGRIDTELEGLAGQLKSADELVTEVVRTLEHYLGRLEAEPGKLDLVEARLLSIEKLKRKYGTTIEEVAAFLEATRQQLSFAENAEAKRVELKDAVDACAAKFRRTAAQLSAARKEAAAKLEKKVEAELGALAMERTRFRVVLSECPWSETGFDGAEFLLAPNAGEEPKPLDRIASGGELSRVALALKAAAVGSTKSASNKRTLVFDEVDAGIGGMAAESVGRRLKRISQANQVLCVTHLAQIAGFADHHYVVGKAEVKGRTVASVEPLTGEARTREIGRMLSGQLTPEALRHAEQLLKTGGA